MRLSVPCSSASSASAASDLRAPLDVAALALLGRIAQALLRHGRRRHLVGDVGSVRRQRGGRAARRELGHPRGEPREVERRGQVVGRGEPAARLAAVADAPVRAGDEDDRRRARLRRLAQLVREREAVAVGQPGIHDDHVGHAGADGPLGPGGLRLGVQVEAGVAQRGADLALQISASLSTIRT